MLLCKCVCMQSGTNCTHSQCRTGACGRSCHPIYIRFPAKTFTNVGMVQRVIKNRVRAPTHHTGNKSPDTRRGSLASLAIHNPCRSRFIAFKRLHTLHPGQHSQASKQVTLKPLSPSLHLATCVVKVACMSSYALKQRWCTQICK